MKNKKPIIIVADDDPDILEAYVVALLSKGFEVLQARDGKEVFEWLDRKGADVDALLLDIVMPGMDGFEVLKKINKDNAYRKIPVVVATNLESEADRRGAFVLGAKDYFEKVKWKPSKVAIRMSEMLEKK